MPLNHQMIRQHPSRARSRRRSDRLPFRRSIPALPQCSNHRMALPLFLRNQFPNRLQEPERLLRLTWARHHFCRLHPIPCQARILRHLDPMEFHRLSQPRRRYSSRRWDCRLFLTRFLRFLIPARCPLRLKPPRLVLALYRCRTRFLLIRLQAKNHPNSDQGPFRRSQMNSQYSRFHHSASRLCRQDRRMHRHQVPVKLTTLRRQQPARLPMMPDRLRIRRQWLRCRIPRRHRAVPTLAHQDRLIPLRPQRSRQFPTLTRSHPAHLRHPSPSRLRILQHPIPWPRHQDRFQ